MSRSVCEFLFVKLLSILRQDNLKVKRSEYSRAQNDANPCAIRRWILHP